MNLKIKYHLQEEDINTTIPYLLGPLLDEQVPFESNQSTYTCMFTREIYMTDMSERGSCSEIYILSGES